ncbi:MULTISPECIES: hypothetical protein [unclassified Nonomuraea]|uniref:hypothetical protein n=1 Tax=unclassified Nonomuraea TaxID=2593643 RepID=UPI003402DBEA
MKNRRRKIIGYRVALVRPYGDNGEGVEVTPLGRRYETRTTAEHAAALVQHAAVIELRAGGWCSADPAGRPDPPRWRVVCPVEKWEVPAATWLAAAAAAGRLIRHDGSPPHRHLVVTTNQGAIAAARAHLTASHDGVEHQSRSSDRFPAHSTP